MPYFLRKPVPETQQIVYSSDSDEDAILLGESALSPRPITAAASEVNARGQTRVQEETERSQDSVHSEEPKVIRETPSEDETDETYTESSTSSFEREIRKRWRCQKSSSSSSTDSEEQDECIKRLKTWKKSRVCPQRIRLFPPKPLPIEKKRRMLNFDNLEPSDRSRALEVHLKMLVYKRLGMLVKSQYEHLGGVTRVVRLYEGRHGAPPPQLPDGCNKVVLRRDGEEGTPWRVQDIRMPYKLEVPDPPQKFSDPSAPEIVDWLRQLRIRLRSHQVRMSAIKELSESSLFSKPDEQFRQVGSVEVNMIFDLPVPAERTMNESAFKYELQMIFSGGTAVMPQTVNVFNQGKKIRPLTDVLMKIATECSMLKQDCKSLLPFPSQPPLVNIAEGWHKMLSLVTTRVEEILLSGIFSRT